MTKAMEKPSQYIVLGSKPWNKRVFQDVISRFSGKWMFLDNLEKVTFSELDSLNPRYIFFLHWSSLVPEAFLERFECVCFHMTDVPFGRGGSPLQNLIARGYHSTKLTAFRMTKELDAGPVYQKRDLSLEGNAEEIYIRATYLSSEMIRDIISTKSEPVLQKGEVVVFKRRTPDQSEMQVFENLQKQYDHIRMLDAEGYPHAFFIRNGFRYEFSRAGIYDGKIVADVVITKVDE